MFRLALGVEGVRYGEIRAKTPVPKLYTGLRTFRTVSVFSRELRLYSLIAKV